MVEFVGAFRSFIIGFIVGAFCSLLILRSCVVHSVSMHRVQTTRQRRPPRRQARCSVRSSFNSSLLLGSIFASIYLFSFIFESVVECVEYAVQSSQFGIVFLLQINFIVSSLVSSLNLSSLNLSLMQPNGISSFCSVLVSILFCLSVSFSRSFASAIKC